MEHFSLILKAFAYILNKVDTMKRTRFWGLVLSPIVGVAVYRLPEIITAIGVLLA